MVVFDELPLTSLLDGSGRIDRFRYPNFAALARGSTWYANATTVADSTKLAIPSILDGRRPRVGVPATHRGHPRNIFTLLHGARATGSRCTRRPPSLCPYAGCRRRRRRTTSSRATASAGSSAGSPGSTARRARRCTTSTRCCRTCRGSSRRQLRRYDRSVLGPIPGLNSSDRSVFDRTLVRQSWQRHLLQVGAVDTLLGEIIERMKATGIYDRAALVVMADHGVSFHVGATDRRTIVPAERLRHGADPAVHQVARPAPRADRPLDVAHLRRAAHDRAPDRTAAAARAGGRSAASAPVRRRRAGLGALARSDRPGHVLPRPPGAGRRAALRRKIGLFGSGPRSLFDFGPNRGRCSAARERPARAAPRAGCAPS